MEKILNISVKGVASHGGMTGLNNLDFWKEKKLEEFNLLYEAYEWFNEVLYISDSEWIRWKCYDKGVLIQDDNRSLGEIAKNGHMLLNSTIHPESYFDRHFYE